MSKRARIKTMLITLQLLLFLAFYLILSTTIPILSWQFWSIALLYIIMIYFRDFHNLIMIKLDLEERLDILERLKLETEADMRRQKLKKSIKKLHTTKKGNI